MADPTQIHQVAMNFITNAYHALEADGGRIIVRLKQAALNDTGYSEMGLEPLKSTVLTISEKFWTKPVS